MERKLKCAWRKWKMPSACYSPTRNIKNPFLEASWKVWMSSGQSQVPPCRKLSLPGCLHNGSAINHPFCRLSVLLQAPYLSHQGNKTTAFDKCSRFLPCGCCSKIISPSGHPGWKLLHTFTSDSNARPEHSHPHVWIEKKPASVLVCINVTLGCKRIRFDCCCL